MNIKSGERSNIIMSNEHVQEARPRGGNNPHIPNWSWVKKQWDDVRPEVVAKAISRLRSEYSPRQAGGLQ